MDTATNFGSRSLVKVRGEAVQRWELFLPRKYTWAELLVSKKTTRSRITQITIFVIFM